jgi:hypothetical protein
MRRQEDRRPHLSEDRSGSGKCIGLCPLDVEFQDVW